MELYCPYFACECAKADIFIIDSKGDECGRYCLGWNKKAFYDEYYKGGFPCRLLAPLAKQGEHAEAFLELLQDLWDTDDKFCRLIIAHYVMVKVIGYTGESIFRYKLLREEIRQSHMRKNPLKALGKMILVIVGVGKSIKNAAFPVCRKLNYDTLSI